MSSRTIAEPINPVAPVTNTFIVIPSLTRKGFSNHFFAFLPKSLRPLGIERISAHSFAYAADRHIPRARFPRRGSFRNSARRSPSAAATTPAHTEVAAPCGIVFHSNGPVPSAIELIVHLFDHVFDAAGLHVPPEVGLDDSWMHGRSAHSTLAVPLVEGDGEETICGLRPAIRDEGIIGRSLKVRIVEVDIGRTGAPPRTN